MKTIIIIDDCELHRLIYRTWLRGDVYRVIEAENAADGLRMIVTERPDCVILDNMMKGGSGLTLLHEIDQSSLPTPSLVFLSSFMTEDLCRNAKALGAMDCFEKNKLDPAKFLEVVARACHESEIRKSA